jgi:hypothetical protein
MTAPKHPSLTKAEIAARIVDAGKRALREAEERHAQEQAPPERPKEINGPKGPEPTRYGDWERKGVATDF